MSTVPTRMRRSSRDRVLVTPEGIAVPVTVASRGARAGALMLDLTFIFLLILGSTLLLFYIAGGAVQTLSEVENDSAAGRALQFLMIVWIIILFLFRNAYFLYFELGPRGATPGKRLAGIRIAARDGGRLTAEMVIARNLLRDIELFLPIVFLSSAGVESGAAWLAATGWFLIFMLFPMFNRDALRAGDIIAGSWVVERPRQKLESVLSSAQRTRYQFGEAELSVYGEYELQALERVLRERRHESIESVYQTISAKIGRTDGWNDERAFLEDYYTQLRARLEAGMRMGRRKADKFAGERR